MKNLFSFALSTVALATVSAVALASNSSGNNTQASIIAICKNKFFGNQTEFIGHFDKRGALRNVETVDLELVLPSLPVESSEDGIVFGPRYSSILSSGAVTGATLAGRNVSFYFAGNGGLVIDAAWGGTVPTAIEFNTNDEVIKSFSVKITYLSQRNAQIVEEVTLIEDCVFHGMQKLIKAANVMNQ